MTCFNPWPRNEPQPKPSRGSAILAREKDDTDRIANERKVGAEVRKRDGYKCRWPEPHKCRGLLEAAHILDKSLQGPTCTENEVSVCAWIHRRGPQSIHGKQLKVEKDSPAGANGILSYWRQDGGFDALGAPTYYLVGRNGPDGIGETD